MADEPLGGPADSEAAIVIRNAQNEIRTGNLPDAANLLDEALASEPDNPEVWVTIARLRYRGGEHLGAIEAADRALELGPGFAPALLLRGQMVRDANGLGESLPWFEAAIYADPENVEALGEYAATLGDLGRHRDMLGAVGELSQYDRDNTQALYLQAVLAARAQEPVLARSLLDRSGWAAAKIPAAMLLDAVIDIEQGNSDAAAETLADLMQRQPANRRVRNLYARALWDAGRDEKLITELTPVINRPAGAAYLTMLVGRAYERLGDRGIAAKLISRAQEAPNRGWQVLPEEGVLGGVLSTQTAQMRRAISSGDVAGAKAQAARLERQFPQSADVLALIGDAAFVNGNATKALDRYSVSAGLRRPWPLTRRLIEASQEAGEERVGVALMSRYALGDPRNIDAIIAIMLKAQDDKEWTRVAQLADYAIALGGGQDATVLDARVKAALELGNEGDTERFQILLNVVRPAKLVVD